MMEPKATVEMRSIDKSACTLLSQSHVRFRGVMFGRNAIPQAKEIEGSNRVLQGQELTRAGTGPQGASDRVYNYGRGSLMATEAQLRSGVTAASLAEEQLAEVRKSIQSL